MTINAGTINIQLERKPPPNIKNSCDLIPFTNSIDELNKLDLISRLERSQTILTTPLLFNESNFNFIIQIQVLCSNEPNEQLGNEGHFFLDLMLLVNRSSTSPFLSVFGDQVNQKRSLLDIFIHLPSPHIDQHLSEWFENTDILEFLSEDILSEIPCMKTRLYTYQKHSLWKILQRELAPRQVEKYQVVKLIAVDETNYYFNQLTGEISMDTEFISDAKGGIICEDMGTGKTCICLATVMATKDLSNPTIDQHQNLQTELTDKQYFPGIPLSLKAICAQQILRLGINWKPVKQNLPLDVVEWFQKYPMYYEWTDIPPNYFERSRRIEPNFTTLKVYLSNATLVVVPDNLVAQWTGEIYKHIQDGQLRFLVFDDDTKQKMISPIQLADYDLILISQNRFSQENTKGGLDFKSKICQCPFIGSSISQRACICAVTEIATYTSPLLQVHWKRLIVDEGHRLSSKNRQSELSSKLFSNWKWICTGTPTQNLTESASMRTRQESEADDLIRLGRLFGQALNIEPFRSNKKLWQKMMSKPFLEDKPWAIQKVTSMMERTMIRNQRQDMDKEVTLPPLYQNIIYLDFDYYQWIAHNCQIAMISLNAILSKREGPDYLFSSNNYKSLRETVHNLWQSCLWHSIDLKQLQTAYDNSVEKCLDVEKGHSDYGVENQDLVRIKDVLKHALDDKMFICMMTQHSPSYVVQGLPNLFKETWGWCKGDHGAYGSDSENALPWDDHCVIDADRIVNAIDVISRNILDESKDLFVYNGSDHTLQSVEEYHANKLRKKRESTSAAKKKKEEENKKKLQDGTGEEKKDNVVIKKLPAKKKRKVNDTTKEAVAVDDANEESKEEEQLTFYTKSAFSDARVLSSSSVKINYLVNQIYRYQSTEKCIIFSQHYNEMYEIYLALQLAKIRVLMYQDSRMNNAKRSQMILTFNTSDNANVIIMAVQKAAYGIDLSSATRVFFVSPVWQTAMEQQAIKRAHRIGQTKPVYIETLVIRDTIEDKLLERRNQVSNEAITEVNAREDKENLKRGDFFADSKLRNILNHAIFVPLPKIIMQDEETGRYHQKIVALDAPLYFVPRKKKALREENDLEDQQQEQDVVMEEEEQQAVKKTLFPPDSSDEDELDVDEQKEEQPLSIPHTPQLKTYSYYEDEINNNNSSTDDDLMLDIEGDNDIMDNMHPWKMRLLESEKKSRKRQRSSSASTSPAPNYQEQQLQQQENHNNAEEGEPSRKKIKKSIKFA